MGIFDKPKKTDEEVIKDTLDIVAGKDKIANQVYKSENDRKIVPTTPKTYGGSGYGRDEDKDKGKRGR